jgi:DNA polymerase III epsilon subunit-like protein
MYLFFDTETTGLPLDWKAPAEQFPRLVQLGYMIFDENKKHHITGNHLIKPEGFEIPKSVSDLHGITTEIALNEGENLKEVLARFVEYLNKAKYIIGHNLSFDRKIMRGEFIREHIEYNSDDKIKICTMHSSRKYCNIKGVRGTKLPTLQELHIKLFGKSFEEAHNALADVNATSNCFWKMEELGLLNGKL